VKGEPTEKEGLQKGERFEKSQSTRAVEGIMELEARPGKPAMGEEP